MKVMFLRCVFLSLIVFCGCRKSIKTAIQTGARLQYVQRLIANGVAIDDLEEGGTPLYWAAASGRLDVVLLLLDAGADVNAPNRLGRTALHAATGPAPWHVQIAAEFIQRGAPVNAVDETGVTPLHLAAVNGGAEMIALLVGKGANVNARDTYGNTPLHWVAQGPQKVATAAVRVLLAAGADPLAENSGHQSPLEMAASFGRENLGLVLLSNYDLDALDERGNTLLHTAVRSHNLRLIELLVEAGADINAVDRWGDSPLVLATRLSCRDEILTFLRTKGAVAKSGPKEFGPLAPPSEMQLLEQAKEAHSIGGDVNAADPAGTTLLHQAARYGYVELAEFLLSERARVDLVDIAECTPLHYAVMNAHIDLERLLLQNGANANPPKNPYGYTPLHFAVMGKEKHLELAEPLVESGANVNAVARTGLFRPLHFAANTGNADAVRLLLDAGAEVNARDAQGGTALHAAAKGGHTATVQLLLARGAEKQVRDTMGKTPLDVASESGLSEVAALLKE